MITVESDIASLGRVALTLADDPAFDARAGALLPEGMDAVQALKPYLIIVTNRDLRTVVAYSLSWSVTSRNGTTETRHTQFKYPDAVAGTGEGLGILQGREIHPGQERLAGTDFELWPIEYVDEYLHWGSQIIRKLGDVQTLRVGLDAVIFDDGTLLGPDRSHLAEHFIEFVKAKQTLYRDVLVGLETGEHYHEIFESVRAIAADTSVDSNDSTAVYENVAAIEILNLQRKITLEVFRRALRREAFSIRREAE